MAKKKEKDKEKARPSRAEAVRSAVDQAFQATAGGAAALTQKRANDLGGRATEIADELAGAVTKLRETLEESRPATSEDVRALRDELAVLRARVDALEAAPRAAAPAAAPKPARATPRSRAGATQAAAQRAPAAAAKKGASGRTPRASSADTKKP